MERRRLGKTGMEVSLLGFGGGEIGFENASVDTVRALLDAALDAGLNAIDTAPAYMRSEELLGEAVAGRRKEFFLFTKCGATEGFAGFDWTAKGIASQIERSLRALRTDMLDLIQLHSCGEDVLRRGEAIDALRRARERGQARFLGYSGDGAAARYAIQSGAFDVLQTSVSIADQESIDGVLPLARERGLGVIAKRPVANAVWRTGARPSNPYHHTYYDRIKLLDYDFLRGDPAPAMSIAMRFTAFQPGVHTAIVGTARPGRWQENARILAEGPLPEATVAAIRARWKAVAPPGWGGQT